MQSFAKTLVHTGHVQYDEAASAEPLKFALQTYAELGIVHWERRMGLQGEQIVTLELEPEYRGREVLDAPACQAAVMRSLQS